MLIILVLATTGMVVAKQHMNKDIESVGEPFGQGEFHQTEDFKEKLQSEQNKVEVLGKIFQKHVDMLIASENNQNLELVFLIDASSSVGPDNFQSELQFVRKMLADFTISYDKTRVALITFSSVGHVKREVDMMSQPNIEFNKCSVLHHQVQYTGGGTDTLGAMLDAQDIFSYSRLNSQKVLFLVTDGFSNGGDPRGVARALKSDGIVIYCFGISNGNTAELFDMASKPEEDHCFILDSFDEFVGLARRALHRDLSSGVYVPVVDSAQCVDKCGPGAYCSCGLRTGQYQCLCSPGFYGPVTDDQETTCRACPNGTYTAGGVPGDVKLCIPCPDVNHITLKPGTSMKDCICKPGFIANGFFCQMVPCPVLTAPRNGLFVGGSCNNAVYSSCRLRCESDYSLIGSDTRLCQPDSKWSGKPTECIIKRCPRLQAPMNGEIVCSPEVSAGKDFPIATECSFSCSAGSELVGSPVRTCLPLARWDGLPTICKPVKCLALPNVTNGVWEPEECRTKRKLFYGQVCKMQCRTGFERDGSETRECGPKGVWTDNKEAVRCVDTMVPNLECPKNITVPTVLGEAYADGITWNVPDPQDNSNQSVLLWSDPPVHPPSIFYIGNTVISYVATDTSYNQAVCHFSIHVIDKEPPTVEDCESPPPIFITERKHKKIPSWSDTLPQFIDNSLEELFVNSSHLLEDLPIGTTEVTFTGVDLSGNSISCVMNYTLIDNGCKQLPLHVIAHCKGDSCTLSCEEGYMFESENATMVIPHPCPLDIPECLKSEEPNVIEQAGRATFTPSIPELCDNTNFLNQLNRSVQRSLVDECNNSSIDCYSIRIDAQCEAFVGSTEEESDNLVKRRRRSVPERNVNINFKVTSRIRSKKPQEKVTPHIKGDKLFENIPSIKSSNLVLWPHKVICPPGTVLKRNRCVHCPPGTFWKEGERDCVACSFGTFQPLPSQQQCVSCPSNTSTRIRHARSANACRDICPSGTYSRRGVGELGTRPCVSCPVGQYQPQVGAQSCLQCPSLTTTSRRRTALLELCHQPPAPCQTDSCLNGGTCHPKRGRATCICPADYIGSQCEFKKTECQSTPCLYGGTCVDVLNGHVCHCHLGFTGKDCEIDIDECASNPCLNGGECSDLKVGFVCHCPPAFQGALCEVNVDDCLARPCAEASSCVDLTGNYSCACRPGYSGRSCQLDPCLSNTICHNNGLCHLSDNITHPYWCECELGFKGVHCEEEIDPCSPSPCLNNATCVPQPKTVTAQCTCPPGYMGDFCETRILSNFTLFFASSGTLNYAIVEEPKSNMNELTVCLWMQTDDRVNYGTVFSYATTNHDNTLTLTDYNGLVLYVNGERVVTDVTANDGAWHHICFEWTSLDGQWLLYKDGVLMDRGIGLSNATNIPGGGVLVLGQDQDSVGGGFNAAESLVGRLAHVNLWSQRLSGEQIGRLFTQCSAQQDEGDIVKWSQFRAGVRGAVQIGESPFCQGCGNLSNLPNTKIELTATGDVATYTCDLGYSMKFLARYEIYKLERRCMIHGEWEGETPLCSKVRCGFPGYFPSGWIIGRSYRYGDEIEYVCQGGNRLVGDQYRRCLANGTWSGEVPSCLGGDCPDLFPPEHGKMWASYQDSYKLEFECDVGYEMHSNSVLICLSNKTWTDHPPKCIMKTCKYANNASVEVLAGPGSSGNNSYFFGTLIQISCPKGYRSNEEPYKTTCGDFGWYPSPPTRSLNCSQVICPTFIVANGSIIDDTYSPGAKAIVRCDKGFQLHDLEIPICTEEGSWSGQISCEPVTCPGMTTEHLSLPRSEFGKIATIQCSPGMILLVAGQPAKEQEVRWICRENGQWVNLTSSPVDPHILSCIKSCPVPQFPEYGFIASDTQSIKFYQEGNKVKVQCHQGYSLKGSDYLTCINNGTWTNSTICEAVDCGVPPELGLTQVPEVENTRYGSVVRLGCQEGYQAYGDTAIRCQANAKWSRHRGRCVRISCGKPKLDEGVSFIGSAYLFQESLTVLCPAGHTLVGDTKITCLKDGKWSSLPKCKQ